MRFGHLSKCVHSKTLLWFLEASSNKWAILVQVCLLRHYWQYDAVGIVLPRTLFWSLLPRRSAWQARGKKNSISLSSATNVRLSPFHLPWVGDNSLCLCPGTESTGQIRTQSTVSSLFFLCCREKWAVSAFYLCYLGLFGWHTGRQRGKVPPHYCQRWQSCSMTDRIFPMLQVVIHRINSLRVTKEGPRLTNWANSAVLFL